MSGIQTRRLMTAAGRGVALVLGALLAVTALQPSPAWAGTKITTVNHTDGNMAVGFPHQRKVLRDASGYWYAVWMDDNGPDTCSPTATTKRTRTAGPTTMPPTTPLTTTNSAPTRPT